jgi:hypothetical protein
MSKEKPQGNRPDWDLRYLNKETDEKGSVGVAWNNADGSIRIKLNPRVTLVGEPSCILTLFKPRDGGKLTDRPFERQLSQQEIDDKPF